MYIYICIRIYRYKSNKKTHSNRHRQRKIQKQYIQRHTQKTHRHTHKYTQIDIYIGKIMYRNFYSFKENTQKKIGNKEKIKN